MRLRLALTHAVAAFTFALAANPVALACDLRNCEPTVETGTGALTASYFGAREGLAFASNSAPSAQVHRWRLQTPCQVSDEEIGGCNAGQRSCPEPPGRLVEYYVVQSQKLVPPDRSSVDGDLPPPDAGVGEPFGVWTNVYAGCVDVTDLNPPPSPDEVYRFFRTLPLPQLAPRQQQPGNALVNLPVIFFTDSPTAQTFTVDIRGFSVVIVAGASQFTWHTGDGTDLVTDSPGAPYPDQTVTHAYRSGTYTAFLTTTWSATYSVNGGASADVPGTTTTDGPPVTFTVLQARTVLTDPTD